MTELAIPVFPPSSGLLKPPRTARDARAVVASRFSESPLRGIRSPGTGSPAQRAGKRYEKKVINQLSKLLSGVAGIQLLPSPWIAYSALSMIGEERHCQPDLLILRETEIIVCEIKLTHTLDAYWQLEHLYRPVVEHLHDTSRPVRTVEITRSFDPVILFPKEMRLFFSIEHLLRTPIDPSKVEVLQWKL